VHIEELQNRIAPYGEEAVLRLPVNTTGKHSKEGNRMNPMTSKEGFDLEIQIEELEPKVAPDGGETVLPLAHGKGNK
jgi:hypothetical protein